MGKYNLVCMAFDGEYKRERIDFNTIEEATVAAIFKKCSRMQEAQGMDIYRFANLLNEKGV